MSKIEMGAKIIVKEGAKGSPLYGYATFNDIDAGRTGVISEIYNEEYVAVKLDGDNPNNPTTMDVKYLSIVEACDTKAS